MSVRVLEKTIPVEAFRYAGEPDDLMGVIEWLQDSGYRLFNHMSASPASFSIEGSQRTLYICDQRGQKHLVAVGDWVLRTIYYEFESRTHEQFQGEFEPIPNRDNYYIAQS